MKLSEKQRIHLREILKTTLAQGVSQIVFEKADHSVRVISGSRDKDLLPKTTNASNTKSTRAESTTSLPLYDLEEGAWRSFSLESLISINGLKATDLVRLV